MYLDVQRAEPGSRNFRMIVAGASAGATSYLLYLRPAASSDRASVMQQHKPSSFRVALCSGRAAGLHQLRGMIIGGQSSSRTFSLCHGLVSGITATLYDVKAQV